MSTLLIPLPDGETLAGYAFTVSKPATTLILSDPYRNFGYFREKSQELGKLLNSNGFNYVALDVRGTGKSTGFAKDEYTEQETLDTLTAISFITKQKWSDGKIALYGLSYSGFTAIQTCVAAAEIENFDEKKDLLEAAEAVVGAFIMHASDDRWDNDVHWWGGVKTVSDLLGYATAMTPFNCLPGPDGKDRLEMAKHPWVFNWTTKEEKYWSINSVRGRTKKLKIPVLNYCGWHDLYLPSSFRFSKNIPNNVTIIGNSGHKRPSTHDSLLIWFLRNYPSIKGQTTYILPQDPARLLRSSVHSPINTPFPFSKPQWVKAVSVPDLRLKFGSEIPVSLQNLPIYGPLYRHCSQSIIKTSLFGQLRERGAGYVFPRNVFPKFFVSGPPIVDLEVESLEKDFYVVAWLLNVSGKILSSGVQRAREEKKERKGLRIEMSPVFFPERLLGNCVLFFSLSNLPSLMPQFWVKSLSILKVKVEFCLSHGFPMTSPLFPMEDYKESDVIPEVKSQIVKTRRAERSEEERLRTELHECRNEKGECEDESLDLEADEKKLTAKFTNRVRASPESDSIVTVTTLSGEGRRGTLKVDTYLEAKGGSSKTFLASKEQVFSL